MYDVTNTKVHKNILNYEFVGFLNPFDGHIQLHVL